MFKPNKKFLKFFKEFTPEEQQEWVEKQTEKVLRRLPTLRKKLSLYDDKSDELYMMEGSNLQLIKNVYQKSGYKSKQALNFVSELSIYGSTSIKKLIKQTTATRIESFLANIKAVGGAKEYEYAKSLLNQLTEKEKTRFVRSKYFFNNGDLSSENFVKFLNEYGVSVGVAKLEGFMLHIGKDINIDTTMYYGADTNIKLGRPKKK